MNFDKAVSGAKATLGAAALLAWAASAFAEEACPISENVRGHENVEWSIGYAFHLTDKDRNLPRVLLVGDSICNGYQGTVQKELEGKMNVSYWVSSYGATSPNYLKLLDVYLSEAKYDVVHFNNGLHSLGTPDAAWAQGLRAAFALIRRRQPQAKIVWCSSTPYRDEKANRRVREQNACGAKLAAELGFAVNDLFALVDPLDRGKNWSDACHHKPPVRVMEGRQVAKICLEVLNGAAPSAAPAAKTPAKALARFDFEEKAGSDSEDAVSGAQAVLSCSAKWARGPFGGALATGAADACAQLGRVPGLDGASSCSLFVRFRQETAGCGKYPCVLSSEAWGAGGVLLFPGADGSLSVRLRAAPNGPETSLTAFKKVPRGKWCSVAVVFARPDVTVYADGQAVARGKWDHPFAAGPLRLGAWGRDSFGGFIDDFRVWSGAVDAQTIAELAEDARYAEVEGYQDDGTGGMGRIEVTGQGCSPFATLAGDAATLTFDTSGAVISLKENATGRELVTNAIPFVAAKCADGQMRAARRIAKRGEGRFAWTLGRRVGEVELAFKPFKGGWTVTVEKCPKDVSELEFCRLEPVCRKWIGAFASAQSDERSAVAVRAYGVEATSRARPLSALVSVPFSPVGQKAGLAAGPRAGFREQLKAMTREACVPMSDCGGAWAMDSETARRSYVFADVRNGDVDYWIGFVKRAGFANIHLSSYWSHVLGPYPVNPGAFPGGLDELARACAKVHDAGLEIGIHTLTGCISPHSEWIRPLCDTNLVADYVYTLAEPLAPDAEELVVEELPGPKHSTVYTYSSNGNVLRIGRELLQYSGVRREKPYAFTGLKRGCFGTKKNAAALPAGTRVDYLHQRYCAFYPVPGSPLAEKLVSRLAEVYNTCGMDEFYFDGSEGMGYRYGIDAMRHAIFSRLKPHNGHSPSIEASCDGVNNWWFQTRTATVDHGVWGVKRFHDWHVNWAVNQGRNANFLEPQMGWWQPRLDVPYARGHMLDEMEYFAAKNAGHDAAMSIQGVGMRPLPFGIRRQMTVLGWYEYARLARAFRSAVQAYLAEPRTESRLRQNDAGVWTLENAEEFRHRAGFPWTKRAVFASASARPALLRVEALYRAGTNAAPLVTAADFAELKAQSAHGVQATLEKNAAGEHGPAFRLAAANVSAPQNGAWARAQLAFPFPGKDAGKERLGFSAWVKGDGSGALLNLQLTSPGEFHYGISEHYVRLDFTGWKRIAVLLRERDAADYWKYVWPYGGGYAALYRNSMRLDHVATFAAYLNDVPPGKSAAVEIGEVTACDMQRATLENAAVNLNGTRFALPFPLVSGEYAELDGGFWTHFSARGNARARVAASAGARLAAGANAVALEGAEDARAELTLLAFSDPRPAFRDDLSPAQKHVMRHEAAMPFAYAPAKGLLPPAVLPVRPGAKARLEVEISGPVKNPVLLGRAFAADVRANELLVCRDGRNWKIVQAKDGKLVKEGALAQPLPVLAGSVPFAFSGEVPADGVCEVDVLKEYE